MRAGRAVGLLVLSLLVLGAQPTAAQSNQDFEAVDQLYAIHELHQGGRILYRQLFANGWPTSKEYRDLTQGFSGESADLLLAAYIASGAGQSVATSDYQHARVEARRSRKVKVTSAAGLLKEELRTYGNLSGYEEQRTDRFRPVFMPYRRSKNELEDAWDDEDLRTWRWKTKDEHHTLEALGFALLAESGYAYEQLSHLRTEKQKGTQVGFLGLSARSGFFALLSLQSAAAKVWELRHNLAMDFNTGNIKAKAELLPLTKRRFLFPRRWSSKTEGGKGQHKAEGKRLDSSLRGQAAVLLGVSHFARLTTGSHRPRTIQDLWRQKSVRNRRVYVLDPRLPEAVVDVALFSFESIRRIHVDMEGRGRAFSISSPRDKGPTISPVDLGLLLMATEAFLTHVELPKTSRSKALAAKLKEERDKARTMMSSMSRMIRRWQGGSRGFHDSYSSRGSKAESDKQSLASQAFAIRGLLASHRILAAGRSDSPYLRSARVAVEWLDRERWDPAARAYVEKDKRAVRRSGLFGAMAVLGALRDMALETGDGRYLVRYQQFLHSLRKAGLVRPASGSRAPSLSPEVTFARSK